MISDRNHLLKNTLSAVFYKKKIFVSRFYFFFLQASMPLSKLCALRPRSFDQKVRRLRSAPTVLHSSSTPTPTSYGVQSEASFDRWCCCTKTGLHFQQYEFFSLTLSQQNSHYLYCITSTVFLEWKRSSKLHTNPSWLYDAHSLTLRETTNQKTDQEQFIRSTAVTARPPMSVRPAETRLTEHKRATKKGDLNNNIAEHHLKTNHAIDWDSATCLTYSTDYYQRITLESWFTNLEQTALNRCQPLPALYKRLLNRKQ